VYYVNYQNIMDYYHKLTAICLFYRTFLCPINQLSYWNK